MIHIETTTLKEHKEYDEIKKVVQIEGDRETVKKEIKTLFQNCKSDDNLRIIFIQALTEVLNDN